MNSKAYHIRLSLLTFFGRVVLLLTILTQTATFGARIITNSVIFHPNTGAWDFLVTFDSNPNFFQVDSHGGAADAFQYFIGHQYSSGPYPRTTIIRGAEIYVNGDIPIRDVGPPSSDPSGAGWGAIRGSVPFDLSGDSVRFSISTNILGVTGDFSYWLEGYNCGGFNYDWHGTATVWNVPPPSIVTPHLTQTAETGSAVALWVKATGSSPLSCQWYLNYSNFISSNINWEFKQTNLQFFQLKLTNVQFAQSGAYTAVISNVLGTVTSSPATLNVIAAVEHRQVPVVKLTGDAGSLLNVDCANSLNATTNWTTLGSISLTNKSQYCFDLTLPLAPQHFYRAWQSGTPSVISSLSLLGFAQAITFTGSIGGSVRLDYINQYGPIDAWFTLDTVMLTNTSQLYFDTSAPGKPPRLYRLVR